MQVLQGASTPRTSQQVPQLQCWPAMPHQSLAPHCQLPAPPALLHTSEAPCVSPEALLIFARHTHTHLSLQSTHTPCTNCHSFFLLVSCICERCFHDSCCTHLTLIKCVHDTTDTNIMCKFNILPHSFISWFYFHIRLPIQCTSKSWCPCLVFCFISSSTATGRECTKHAEATTAILESYRSKSL